VTVTVALSLLYLGVIRIFEPNTSDRALLVGVYLIAVAAALCLNAVTVGGHRQVTASHGPRTSRPRRHSGTAAPSMRPTSTS
jgi:hypothetical protein